MSLQSCHRTNPPIRAHKCSTLLALKASHLGSLGSSHPSHGLVLLLIIQLANDPLPAGVNEFSHSNLAFVKPLMQGANECDSSEFSPKRRVCLVGDILTNGR